MEGCPSNMLGNTEIKLPGQAGVSPSLPVPKHCMGQHDTARPCLFTDLRPASPHGQGEVYNGKYKDL